MTPSHAAPSWPTSPRTRSPSCRRSSGSATSSSVGWALLAAALVALPHLVVDDGRIVCLYLTRVKHAEPTDARIAGPVDQAFHALSLCIVALLIGAA